MNERFDRLESRTDRSEARLGRCAVRMIEWTEKTDGLN